VFETSTVASPKGMNQGYMCNLRWLEQDEYLEEALDVLFDLERISLEFHMCQEDMVLLSYRFPKERFRMHRHLKLE